MESAGSFDISALQRCKEEKKEITKRKGTLKQRLEFWHSDWEYCG